MKFQNRSRPIEVNILTNPETDDITSKILVAGRLGDLSRSREAGRETDPAMAERLGVVGPRDWQQLGGDICGARRRNL
jgi:hypothetical protein